MKVATMTTAPPLFLCSAVVVAQVVYNILSGQARFESWDRPRLFQDRIAVNLFLLDVTFF